MTDQEIEQNTQRVTSRHGRLRRSSAWRNVARVLVTTALVGVLSGVSVAAYAVWGLVRDVDTVDLGTESAEAIGAGQQSIDGAFTILLVGSDSRAGQSIDDGEEGELNDVTLVLNVSEDHQNATVMSFPRDLMVPFPSCPGPKGEEGYYPAMSEQQFNSSLQYGGLPCTAQVVESLTGLDIDYAGLVTFDGVIGVSKAIGGVDVCLAQPIVDPKSDLDLPAGDVSLVGTEALQFLRTRAGVGDGGDVSRISNQQIFMSALIRQLKSAETLADPVKVYGLAKAGVENMTLSSNMASVQFMQALAGTVKDIDLDRINFVQYPTTDHPYQEGRLLPDRDSAQIVLDLIESGQPFEVTGRGQAVEEEASDDPVAENAEGSETEAPVETEAPADGTETPAPTEEANDEPVQLPDNITGQGAAAETCSAGRTVY